MIDTLRRLGQRLAHDDRGAGLIEYCLVLALIALVCFGALTYFGGESGNSVTNSCGEIATATGDAATDCEP
jgi:Flp pilus assembly pilin Flp